MDEERPNGQTEAAENEDDEALTPQPMSGCEEAPQSNALEATLELPPEVTSTEAQEQRVRLAEDRLAQVLAAFRQLKADNDGYRSRTRRNLEHRYGERSERLLLKFIDILDNFDRALESSEGITENHPIFEGMILVRTQLLQTLQQEGLERIPVLGFAFDPHVSEAVGTEIVEDPTMHHIVIRELLRGYRLKGRLARPSRVLVGEYPQAASGQKAEGKQDEEQPGPPPEMETLRAASESPFDALDADVTTSKIIEAHEAEPATVAVESDDSPAPAAESELKDEPQ